MGRCIDGGGGKSRVAVKARTPSRGGTPEGVPQPVPEATECTTLVGV